jgi:hypothetical protein
MIKSIDKVVVKAQHIRPKKTIAIISKPVFSTIYWLAPVRILKTPVKALLNIMNGIPKTTSSTPKYTVQKKAFFESFLGSSTR